MFRANGSKDSGSSQLSDVSFPYLQWLAGSRINADWDGIIQLSAANRYLYNYFLWPRIWALWIRGAGNSNPHCIMYLDFPYDYISDLVIIFPFWAGRMVMALSHLLENSTNENRSKLITNVLILNYFTN
jgi:hypothetical protein